ncbi:ATP-binding protein [Bacteroidales bacterium]|nr:ATP-binding protein [Bacteroidales bacterium]
MLNVDGTLFRQVINNLINNAVKFTPNEKKIMLYVEGDNLIIEDEGVGITGITPNQLFSNEINKTSKGTNGEKGTGVGLVICKKIIDAHNFSITFTSMPNQGTKFIVGFKQNK